MREEEAVSARPITRFLVEDHRRLEALLQAAESQATHVAGASYDRFRAGLLRHIGMEEKILLPVAQQLRGGQPLPIASKLRLDHGALAALLMPTPTAAMIAMIRGILKSHNLLEEGPGGLYETCEQLAGPETGAILAKLQAAPEVAVMVYNDSPTVINAVQRAVERAGYEFRESTR
ncbi:MAG TPA: hemerythrin domain-containing protein [Nitrospira sp.]|nr:hemerythrin domain-containing protein [Nitrospira sp.]